MVILLKVQCPDCLAIRDVRLPYSLGEFLAQRDRWKREKKIQDAFPELDASQREALVTGLCDACFDRNAGNCDVPTPF